MKTCIVSTGWIQEHVDCLNVLELFSDEEEDDWDGCEQKASARENTVQNELFFERISVGKCRNMVLLNPLSGQQ